MSKKEKTERTGSMDDSMVSTRLLEKNYSPLIVRKYQMKGWPMYVGLICDVSLSDLDEVINGAMREYEEEDLIKQDIQAIRNITGLLSDRVITHYDSIKSGCVEGVAILWYVDKTFISSLWGDFMTHMSCKLELYQIINTLPHI